MQLAALHRKVELDPLHWGQTISLDVINRLLGEVRQKVASVCVRNQGLNPPGLATHKARDLLDDRSAREGSVEAKVRPGILALQKKGTNLKAVIRGVGNEGRASHRFRNLKR